MRRVHFVPALSFLLSCPATIMTNAELLRGSPKLMSGLERVAAGVGSNFSPSGDGPENEILSLALHAHRTPYDNHRRQQHNLPSDKEADRQLQLSDDTAYYYQVPGTAQSTQTAQGAQTAPPPPPPVDIKCGTFALGMYWYLDAGFCYDLTGNWWDQKISWIRGESAGGACVEVRDDTSTETYCGNEWAELPDTSMQVSTVCCFLQ